LKNNDEFYKIAKYFTVKMPFPVMFLKIGHIAEATGIPSFLTGGEW
jgi:hypothetical protein